MVLFDWLGSDDFPPLGVMALWPFSSDFLFANAYVFDAISRRYWLPGFVEIQGTRGPEGHWNLTPARRACVVRSQSQGQATPVTLSEPRIVWLA